MIDPTVVRDALLSAGFCVPNFRLAGEGSCCRAWWVDDAHIVRVALDECVDAALELEMEVLPILASAVDVAVPEPVYLGREPASGRRLLVHRAVGGESLAQVWPQLPAAGHQRIAAEVGSFLAQLQSVQLASLPMELREARFHGSHLRTKAIEQLVFPTMPTGHVEACFAMVDGFEPCRREAWTLVHADLYNQHVLVRDRRLSGVIDFGDICQGDPTYDLSTLMDDFGVEFVAGVVSDLPADIAQRQIERARCYCVWEALQWAAEELGAGRTAGVSEGLQRIGQLALDRVDCM